ncbi:MAG: phytanoyl-CoA dioxygenase family protein [Actinomycetota bacterium]|uniref:Phytanoyl-CoA dioxygenase n=1 Tax=marine metagenome TaxID=408172 RepID=A0A381PW33_9ZZZZ|nr:phytanoyl-CoA dioxygenase family protein [Actinomycetota bacterium]MED5553251.1 phytanoyl-CoA dioxygenase family protein [Actinomycetota bacterium]|tara:strand:+ start:151 stop:1020 length:870 start_codon:yes stop_codon:yes gene_type:complete
MLELAYFDADAEDEEILSALREDGACVLVDVMGENLKSRVSEELQPFIEATPTGRDDFTGRLTGRTGALVARSEASRELVMHPTLTGLAQQFLGPYTDKIQLHLTQVINIQPGQGAQPRHRDRLAWGGYVPPEIEPQFNTLWALTDFTEENGATRVVPGSVKWPTERRATDEETIQAVMKAGSVLLYSGSVIHGGGQNLSDSDRTGINITYCLGWLRTEENQYLSCPPSVAKNLDPDLQEMLGYTMGTYALGYFSDPEGVTEVNDLRPPEFVLDRSPREKASNSALITD